MPNYSLEGSRLERIQIGDVDKAFILSNPELEKLLFNRNIVGLEFTQACESASISLLRHFHAELSPLFEEGLSELMLLSKGIYYWMHNAFAQVFGRNLELNVAATHRVEFSGNDVRVIVPYANLDAATDNLIIGDTLASGATLCTALSHYIQQHPLKRVFIFTIAGSIVGGQALSRFCRSHEIDLTIVYGLAAFGLASNGFDLAFLHPDTITSEEYRSRAISAFKGKPISAVGWDFGSQAQAIHKYKMLCWIEAKYWGLQDDEVFLLKERPTDIHLIQGEQAAIRERFSSLESLLSLPDS